MARQFGIINSISPACIPDFVHSVWWNSNFDDDNVLVKWIRTCPPTIPIPITQEIVDKYLELCVRWVREDTDGEFFDFYWWWEFGQQMQDYCYQNSRWVIYYAP